MKKLTTLIICVSAFVFQSQAQTIVGTTPENKNAVLEEFTGIHCVYCPQGHLIAHDILAAHPNDAVIIAIHEGSFATPSAGEPDYRTAFGTAIAGQTGLTGYPAGTVNRHVFSAGMTAGGTAEGRGTWAANANAIVTQSSYVNVGLTANVDYATRIVTIHCEAYYTANSTVANNYLNIALLQNNIKGPQTGASSNPSQVTPDGQYLHQHMLRNMLTGQWGVLIPNTNAASGMLKVDTTFTYTIPASFTSIPVAIPDVEFAAFITESHQEIITGAVTAVNAPPYDAGVSLISNVPTLSCSNTMTPSITLKNYGGTTLTSTTIYYKVDATGTVNSIPWTGSLASGATTTVVLPAITSTSGSHILYVYSGTINGSTDQNTNNDQYQQSYSSFSTNIPIDVTENFTSATFPPTNWAAIDGGDGLNWGRLTATHLTPAGSAYLNFYNIAAGQLDHLVLNPVTLVGKAGTTLTFYVAYRQYASENDRLDVEVSTNCGTTWTSKWNKSGATLKTGVATTTNFTAPTAAEWRQETVDLSAYDGQTDIMIRFKGTSAYGNNVIIDDINLTTATGIADNSTSENNVSVYPNPFTDNTTISVNLIKNETVSYNVINMIGEIVYSEKLGNLNPGTHETKFDASNLTNGMYFVNLQIGNSVITKKVTIIK
ncbi:MAG: Omp28-related outer membrane protein [Bacteroidetes bacterium]|nr:Omp28-related outer membrane protein [Bacteroidota bacterium]